MGINSNELFLMVGIVIGVAAALFGLAWYFICDQPIDQNRFSWHQLIRNSFHLSFIDENSETWVIDIHYNSKTTTPICRVTGEKKLQIQLPEDIPLKDFIAFVKSSDVVETKVYKVIQGVVKERVLLDLHFSKADVGIYRDFKRHLLLKALKH